MSKKQIHGVLSMLLLVVTMALVSMVTPRASACAVYSSDSSIKQQQAHALAEQARSMGLPETDPIILRAQEIWNEEQTKIDRDRDIIATVVYNEAWGGCSDRHRELVAAVVVNRSQSPSWPPTIADVVSQRGQYLAAYVREDSKYQKAARKDPDVWKHCQEIASKAMSGEVDCPESVVFQANFRQGSGTYEVHTTSYSKSYFCYG